MKRYLVPSLAIAFYVAMAIAVTYPGYLPFNTIRPFVLGLPFSLIWQVIWISAAMLVLGGVFIWEKKTRAQSTGHGDDRPQSPDRGSS